MQYSTAGAPLVGGDHSIHRTLILSQLRHWHEMCEALHQTYISEFGTRTCGSVGSSQSAVLDTLLDGYLLSGLGDLQIWPSFLDGVWTRAELGFRPGIGLYHLGLRAFGPTVYLSLIHIWRDGDDT